MTETDNIAYSFPEEEVACLPNLAAVSSYVYNRFRDASKDRRQDIIAGLQERLLCSHWAD